jgi:LCP family protein required for cell wall assembly
MLTATNKGPDGEKRGDAHHGAVRPGSHVYGTPAEVSPKRKRKSPVWAKILVGLGVLIVVIAGGAFTVVVLALKKVNDSVSQTSMLGAAAVPSAEASHALDGPLNLLLVGTDERAGLIGNRSDTIIVMHINAAHNAAYLLSIPRDTLTKIPAFPKANYKGTSGDKINAAFEYGSGNGLGRTGGFELLATTVSQLTGLTFNGGAIVNFDGFTALVQALGGVDMCIDEKTVSFDHDVNGNELFNHPNPMVYLPGCRHLLPWQALDYVRQRHSVAGGDYGRQRHQQQFIKAIAKEAMSQGLTDPLKLNKVIGAAGKALTVDRGAAPSLTDWIFALKGININNLNVMLTNGGKYASLTCPDGSSCQQLTADSLKMFDAAKSDTLPQFIATHPTWVDAGQPAGTPTPTP